MADQAHRTGLLVVVEGIDGTGKSTLVQALNRRLLANGYPSVLTYEPTHGQWGIKLRRSFTSEDRLSLEEEVDLFIRDRREHVCETLNPALMEGKVIVCDRYYFSTMAYQGARGFDIGEIRRRNEAFAPVPDLVLLLVLDPEQALLRIREKRLDAPNNFEQLAYLRKVADIFRMFEDPCIFRLDASGSEEQVLTRAWHTLMPYLP